MHTQTHTHTVASTLVVGIYIKRVMTSSRTTKNDNHNHFNKVSATLKGEYTIVTAMIAAEAAATTPPLETAAAESTTTR